MRNGISVSSLSLGQATVHIARLTADDGLTDLVDVISDVYFNEFIR